MISIARRRATAFLLAVLVCAPVFADGFEATVTRVFDGDSFLVRPARGGDIDVRLADIDRKSVV